jgi:ATP-dependent DNA helicase DinG
LQARLQSVAEAERTRISFAGAETFNHSLQLNSTPLAIAEIMQKQMNGHPRAWIFTSATLAVQDEFFPLLWRDGT